MTQIRTCSIDDCSRPLWATGWCHLHYSRWRRHGDPKKTLLTMSPRGAPRKWLADHLHHGGDECLIWPFARHANGYGHISGGRPNRIMCELVHGAPPSPKHEAAHSCGNGHLACVNPRHLRWATSLENSSDKIIHGTMVAGVDHPAAKLSESDVKKIRSMRGAVEGQELARIFNVHKSCISKIMNHRSWRHL